MKRIWLAVICVLLGSPVFALAKDVRFVVLPNVNTKYMMSTNASKALDIQVRAIEITKRVLNLTPNSPYNAVRIRLIYANNHSVKSIIVSLLSSQYKSTEFVRINLNDHFEIANVVRDYQLTLEDLAQSPYYATKHAAKCPDETVQFVIGNNFYDDRSVEKEVRNVYALAKAKGYNPVLMDVNDSQTLQPTVGAYINWMNCPNVKGFYNESHGWEKGIVLSDDDFVYTIIDKQLVDKFKSMVMLFDSCETFHPPLLPSVLNNGNAQQYIAGIISLPFGASERTATCIWTNAFAQQELTPTLVQDCSVKNDLYAKAFGIRGNGEPFLKRAV